MIYWNWTLPWNIEEEVLIGFLGANNIEIVEENEEVYNASLFSIGIFIGRLDIIFNLNK